MGPNSTDYVDALQKKLFPSEHDSFYLGIYRLKNNKKQVLYIYRKLKIEYNLIKDLMVPHFKDFAFNTNSINRLTLAKSFWQC